MPCDRGKLEDRPRRHRISLPPSNNAKFSNGDPITAERFCLFVSPRIFARHSPRVTPSLGYYIKYSEAYNSGRSFVKDAKGQFLLKKDFEEKKADERANRLARSCTTILARIPNFTGFSMARAVNRAFG